MSPPSFCTHSTTNPRDKTSIKLLLTFCKALYSSNTLESTDFPAQAAIHRSPRLELVHAPENQHWSCHITHPIPGDYRSPPSTGMKRLGMMGLERSCWGWREAAGAGKKLSGASAACDLQGKPQDLQCCPKPAPDSGSLLQGVGPCKCTGGCSPMTLHHTFRDNARNPPKEHPDTSVSLRTFSWTFHFKSRFTMSSSRKLFISTVRIH